MRALAPIHLAAHNPLGILHWNPPLAPFYKYDESHNHHHKHQEDQYQKGAHLPCSHETKGVTDGTGHACHNACKYDKGNPVSDPTLCDLLAQPHDKCRAGSEGNNGHHPKAPSRISHHGSRTGRGHLLQPDADSKALDDTQDNGAVTCVLSDLLPSRLPFLGKPLQVGNHHGQQLQNDGGANIRHNAQGKNGKPFQGTARKHVK